MLRRLGALRPRPGEALCCAMAMTAVGATTMASVATVAMAQSRVFAPACVPERIAIRIQDKVGYLRLRLAETPQARSQGLMFVPYMSPDQGMLFVYEHPQHVRFWMRNTLIPLDMLFIGPDGVVRHIHENARPMDETVIDGGPDVQFVLELNAGLVRALGISTGDAVQHPAIAQNQAAWPCE